MAGDAAGIFYVARSMAFCAVARRSAPGRFGLLLKTACGALKLVSAAVASVTAIETQCK